MRSERRSLKSGICERSFSIATEIRQPQRLDRSPAPSLLSRHSPKQNWRSRKAAAACIGDRDGGCDSSDWLVRLNDRRQFAVGLHCQPTPAIVETALQQLLESERPDDPIATSLTRDYVLEAAAGLRIASACVPRAIRTELLPFCDRLLASACLTSDARVSAERLLETLRRDGSVRRSALASRARDLLDQCRQRMRAPALAHHVGSNVRETLRTFKADYGMTPSRYLRDQLGALAVERARAGDPVKQIAADLRYSEASIRRLVQQATGVTVRTLKQRPPGHVLTSRSK
jgi:AraC-like DNA-binding protein